MARDVSVPARSKLLKRAEAGRSAGRREGRLCLWVAEKLGPAGAGRGEAQTRRGGSARSRATFPGTRFPAPPPTHPRRIALVSPLDPTVPAAAPGSSPLPTTRGLSLGAQERVDFVKGEPAARPDASIPHPPPRAGLAHRSRAGSRVVGQRPGGAGARLPQACQLEHRARGGGEAAGTKGAAGEDPPPPPRGESWLRTNASSSWYSRVPRGSLRSLPLP